MSFTENKLLTGAAASSTLPRCALKSGAALIASAPREAQENFLSGLTENELIALPWLFEFWALPHQLPPDDSDWRTWVIMGGRGAGKTRAGAEWVRAMVEGDRPEHPGRARKVALVAETIDQGREVMIFGESGILACSPPDREPKWEATRKRLVWPNGAEAHLFSAHDPDSLRGPQFDAAWVDELAKWKKADETWTMLQLGLRLGQHPQQVVTTTPQNVSLLKEILAADSTVMTQAPTAANRANLADSFLKEVYGMYAGSSTGRQELAGEILEGVEGALWSLDMLNAAYTDKLPNFDRVVVAVDPSVSKAGRGDECGIVVVGACLKGNRVDWTATVIEDASVSGGGPGAWAAAAVEAFRRNNADRIVAEVNQGGALVEQTIRAVDPLVPYSSVNARVGKVARAEPVAALYEQGRVRHLRGLGKLEDQMCQMTHEGYKGKGSPDRVDALVWALTELMLSQKGVARPRIRSA